MFHVSLYVKMKIKIGKLIIKKNLYFCTFNGAVSRITFQPRPQGHIVQISNIN